MVRLWTHDRQFIETAEVRLSQFAQRTLRHSGILYELIGTDADGVHDYRALEPTPLPPRTATVIDAAGNPCGTVAIPADILPQTVLHEGVPCTLWTTRDQTGAVVYLQSEAV